MSSVPSLTPGRRASQALKASSIARLLPHREHDTAVASPAHTGQRTATRMEMLIIPPSDTSCAFGNISIS
jgi:hypothetical protein